MHKPCGCQHSLQRVATPAIGWSLAGWIMSGAVLLLMPKCPACVVAYVALATGLGLSLTTAAYVRNFLIALCLALLIITTARFLLRLMNRAASSNA